MDLLTSISRTSPLRIKGLLCGNLQFHLTYKSTFCKQAMQKLVLHCLSMSQKKDAIFIGLYGLISLYLWSPAGKGLTSWLLFVMFNYVFVTFPCCILGQAWYLIVKITDLCCLSYFICVNEAFYITASNIQA